MAYEQCNNRQRNTKANLNKKSPYQNAVIKLYCGWVFEEVPPPQVVPIDPLGVERGEELFRRRDEVFSHHWELVVDQTCVEARDEGALRNGEVQRRKERTRQFS